MAPKASGLTKGIRAQKEIDKTADGGSSTGCCTYGYPSLSTSRTAFFSYVASCLIGETLACRPCGFSSHHRPMSVSYSAAKVKVFWAKEGPHTMVPEDFASSTAYETANTTVLGPKKRFGERGSFHASG